MPVRTRLRWQLTISHLIAIAFTLVSMIAALLVFGSTWIARQGNQMSQPVQDAAIVANTVGGLAVRVAQETPSVETEVDLSGVLRALLNGDLNLQLAPPFVPEQARHYSWLGSSFRNTSYVAVVAPDGRVLGSSDPSGTAFSPPGKSEWGQLIAAAMSSSLDPQRLVVVRPQGNPAALGAYPILSSSGHPVAVVLVAEAVAMPASNPALSLGRALALFGAASIVVLTGASLFALASSSLVGYLLARRLVRRLERLGRAAEAFARGDLDSRVEESGDDEVGQLARQLNRMAGQLSATVTELEAEKQHAEAALRAKRELVANVSHELRTPLASIQGHTESLLMRGAEPGQDGQREYLAVIHRESENLSRLIEDLFVLSTAEAGALPLSIEPVEVGRVIEEVVDSIRPVAHNEKRVSVVAEVDPDLPPALADRQRVVQVLGNLLRNALRYTPEGGLIAIRAAQSNSEVHVAVEDTGVGIPTDQLPHVFERFYRGDSARDRATGGSGLGLAIVRELVEAMGGQVSAESVVGQGSRFSFTLPAVVTTSD